MLRRSKALLPLGLTVFALLLGLAPLGAQVPVGPEITIDGLPGNAFPIEVGLAADGSFVALWTREGTLYARLFRANGQPRGGAIRVTRPSGLGSALSVAPDGSFLVVWPKDGAVVGWRFDKNGRPVGRVFNVNAVAGGPSNWPSIARAPDGSFVVAWDRLVAPWSPGDEAPYDIFVRRFSAAGVPLSGEVNLTPVREEQSQPRLAVDAAGRFALVYSRYTGEGTFYDIEALRLGTNAAPRGPAIPVNADDTEEAQDLNQVEPVIGMAADGRFTVLWSGVQPLSDLSFVDGIHGRQLAADGTPRGPVFQIEEAGTRIVMNPAIAMMPDGRFLALWSRRSGNFDPGRLVGRRFAADATPLGAVFSIDSPSSGLSLESAVALNAQGGGVVLWRRFDPVTRNSWILARRLAPAPR